MVKESGSLLMENMWAVTRVEAQQDQDSPEMEGLLLENTSLKLMGTTELRRLMSWYSLMANLHMTMLSRFTTQCNDSPFCYVQNNTEVDWRSIFNSNFTISSWPTLLCKLKNKWLKKRLNYFSLVNPLQIIMTQISLK